MHAHNQNLVNHQVSRCNNDLIMCYAISNKIV
jgi:hypothetical protein